MGLSFDLRGHRLLVVGASSGLGRAIGLAAARAGARVALAARRRAQLEQAAAEAAGAALALPCDVRRESDCQGAVAAAAEALGGLDGLVYAAGMAPLVPVEGASAEQWRAVTETNLIGAALVSGAAIPHLRKSRGRAVYLSSYAVRQCLPGLALYRVSKCALDALIEDLRMEHPDLQFTRVLVGNTEGTEFGAAWGKERLEAATRTWVERRLFPASTWMSPEAVCEAVLSVLAQRGYVDDLAVMPRPADPEIPQAPARGPA